jgi:hypothetical protein
LIFSRQTFLPGRGFLVVRRRRRRGTQDGSRAGRQEWATKWESRAAAALRTELAKPWYPYFNLSLAPSKEPPSPKTLLLGAGNPHVTASRQVAPGEFELTVTFSFRIGNDAYHWNWTMCAKDTEARDGLGLPGSHGCGAKGIPATQSYLG